MSKLYVVGIGPGGYEQMTVKAVKVLEECDIIVGYTVYVDLVAEHFAGKEMLTTPMRQEENHNTSCRCGRLCRWQPGCHPRWCLLPGHLPGTS